MAVARRVSRRARPIIGDLDQAIQLDPKNPTSYTGRCAALINKGETDQALSDCNKAIQLDPKNAVAYANRCAALINKGETDQALSDCNQAILLDPKNAPTRFGYQ